MNAEDILMSFLVAIKEKHLVEITYIAKSDEKIRKRKIAALDLAYSKTCKHYILKLHFWDCDSNHVTSLCLSQIKEFNVVVDEFFNPEKIVTWDIKTHPWTVQRNWGALS